MVRDGEAGRPLANAHVRLPEAQAFRGTATDSTGHFRLPGLLPGPHTVVVSHLGYRRHEATVYVPPDGTARHEATLAPSPIAADSLVIDADRYGLTSARPDADRVPTAPLRAGGAAEGPDALDAAGTVLGVTASPPYADLHIQGSPTGGHTLHLDGMPVRNPASAGRLLSAFSPLALKDLTARKAGFGALHGNALSGTLDLHHALSASGGEYGTVRADSRSLGARLQGTTTIGSTPVSAMVAGRVSMWDVYQDAGLHALIDRWSTLDPMLTAARLPPDAPIEGGSLGARTQPNAGFFDLHGAARFELGPAERLALSVYHGQSTLGADLVLGQPVGTGQDQTGGNENPPFSTTLFKLPTRDEYDWSNTTAQARYESPISGRTTGSLQAGVSHYRSATRSETGEIQFTSSFAEPNAATAAARQAAQGQEGANEVTEALLKGQVDFALGPRWGLVWSGGLTHQRSRFRIGNAFAPRLQHQARSTRLATAAELTVGLGPHAQLEGGLRLTGRPAQGPVFAEPRGAIRYDRPVGGLGTVALSVRGGLYRQFTAQFDLSRDGATAVVPTTQMWLPLSGSLAPPRTYHLAADLTWAPAPRWQIDLEGYRKWQPHLLAIDYPALRAAPAGTRAAPDPAQFIAPSRGVAYGGGLDVTYEGSALTASLQYAYSRAERTFPGRFNGRQTPVPWTQPHRLALNAEVLLGAGVALEATGEGVWGRRWGYRRAYYAYLTPSPPGKGWDEIRLDRPGTHRLPPRYRLDLGVRLAHSWAGVDVEGRLGVANVLGRENVADWGLEPQRDGSVSRWARTLPGRRMTVSIRLRY
ncbi:TonB-dependent receptor [Salinibacter altiplanensis]|uniref:TonB-dependent receptor n=1 Tax=Salinibacter altiplanensis TaxID=1803181 RepID=UPI0021D348B1|nr:carboxypeptidase-like regulatory domain-containing protein [Salinibacter altiplanensis]